MSKNLLYIFTGTGNSLWAGRELASHLGDTEILPMTAEAGDILVPPSVERIGFSFPVHIWGLPRTVIRWIDRLQLPADVYLFALAVNAGQVARTLLQLDAQLRKRRLSLGSGFSLALPSNYTPWGGPGTTAEQEKRFHAAGAKIRDVVPLIRDRQTIPPEKGPWWQNVVFSIIYRTTFKDIPGMDKKFWVDAHCDHCKVCQQVCPVDNIGFEKGKPVWRHGCDQCFACLHGCPRKAIQYGKNTEAVERYQNPQVKQAEQIRFWRPTAVVEPIGGAEPTRPPHGQR